MWTDQQIWLPGVSVSVVHGVKVYFCIRFSTCYLGILGLEGAINCVLARLNLPPKDNLQKEDKSSAPKVSFIRRLHCSNKVSLLDFEGNLHLILKSVILANY